MTQKELESKVASLENELKKLKEEYKTHDHRVYGSKTSFPRKPDDFHICHIGPIG